MNCPFRYQDGAVIFVVVSDLPLEEKVVALAVDLLGTYSLQLPDSFRDFELDQT